MICLELISEFVDSFFSNRIIKYRDPDSGHVLYSFSTIRDEMIKLINFNNFITIIFKNIFFY